MIQPSTTILFPELPWELILRIFEFTAKSSQASAANVALVCRDGASVAQTVRYTKLHINCDHPQQIKRLDDTLRSNATLARLVRIILVDIPLDPAHISTPESLSSVLKSVNTVSQVGDVHVVWANNQYTKAVASSLALGPLRSLLCRYLALEVQREWAFPSLTHLVLLHVSGVGLFSSAVLGCPALTHLACTIHDFAPTPDVFEWLLAPRLRNVLDRAPRGLPPLVLARLFVASWVLREFGAPLQRLVDVKTGADIRLVEIPDEMDNVAMRALARGLSDAHFDGSLWEAKDISYGDIMQIDASSVVKAA